MNGNPMLLLAIAIAAFGAARATPAALPVVVGEGVGLFKIGQVLHADEFTDLGHWIVQLQKRPGSPEGSVEAKNSTLDCMVPGNGCTVWYTKKLQTRVTITYDVICPSQATAVHRLEPRDINNFWMCSDPVDPDQGLFDSTRYTGDFGTYDKMLGYYASTGGGGAANANRTTRMRRYPRETDGQPAEHIALTDKDGKAGFMIMPDKMMTVQLVAFDDLIQYIVDGRLVYQMVRGDRVQVQSRVAGGRPAIRETLYDLDRFPVYREGYFGFRMVGTHHIYSNFRVYALEPDVGVQPGFSEIGSIEELRAVSSASDQRIRMRPGVYRVTDTLADNQTVFNFTGSNNEFDLRGVTIQTDTQVLARMKSKAAHELAVYRIKGDQLHFEGATFEDIGNAPPQRSLSEFSVTGNDVTFKGCTFIVRGSAPYGYGDLYGKGRGAAVKLKKHALMAVMGDRCRIEDCYCRIHTFGHGLHIHGAQDTFIREVTMLGDLRPTDGIYSEPASLAAKSGYNRTYPPWREGQPIPRGEMLSLTEDGIRAYKDGVNRQGKKRRTGMITVEDCFVERMRGGITIAMATGGRITGCTVIDCGGHAYSVPSGGVIRDSYGNAAYSPLLSLPYSNKHNADIELRVMRSTQFLGNHPLASVVGSGHKILVGLAGDETAQKLRPIIIGSAADWPAAADDEVQAKQNRANGIQLTNLTPNPVALTPFATNCEIVSGGPVQNHGSENQVEPVIADRAIRTVD